MTTDVECPYCEKRIEINHDDGYGYEEDELHEQECPECEKQFVYRTVISIHHEAMTADCLNGVPHAYKKTATYPPEFAKFRCSMCGDEQPLTYNAEVSRDEC